MTNLLGEVSGILGNDRAQLLLGDAVAGKSSYSSTWGGAFSDLSKGELFTVCVNPDDPEGLACSQFRNATGGGGVSQNRASGEAVVRPRGHQQPVL